MLADVPADEIRSLLSVNAARIYGFDLARLDPLAAALPEGTADL
jgi:hypothetical protein